MNARERRTPPKHSNSVDIGLLVLSGGRSNGHLNLKGSALTKHAKGFLGTIRASDLACSHTSFNLSGASRA
jgi:hypothetical protein